MSQKNITSTPTQGSGELDTTITRVEEIIKLASTDSIAMSLLEKLLESAERYLTCVTTKESRLKISSRCVEGNELSELTQDLDRKCQLAHTALLDNIAILNSYLLKRFGDAVPRGGIYSKSPESIRDKAAVGDWAGELLYALFVARKR